MLTALTNFTLSISVDTETQSAPRLTWAILRVETLAHEQTDWDVWTLVLSKTCPIGRNLSWQNRSTSLGRWAVVFLAFFSFPVCICHTPDYPREVFHETVVFPRLTFSRLFFGDGLPVTGRGWEVLLEGLGFWKLELDTRRRDDSLNSSKSRKESDFHGLVSIFNHG